MNKNRNWWKRFFGGFGATSTCVRKRKRGLRLEPLETRTMLTINLGAADLSYLLEQVNIGNDYSQFVSPLDPTGVREVSGENNNLVGGFTYNADGTVTWTGNNINPDWGQSDTDFLRIFTTDHPNNGTSYGFTFDPVTMQVIDSGDGTPILGADGQPVIVPADFATQFAEAAIPAPGTSPRTVTQLITSSDVDPASPTYNPAAAAAMVQSGGEAVAVSNTRRRHGADRLHPGRRHPRRRSLQRLLCHVRPVLRPRPRLHHQGRRLCADPAVAERPAL